MNKIRVNNNTVEIVPVRAGESFESYIFRVCCLKEMHPEWTWDDIGYICNTAFNVHCSESYYRKGFAAGRFAPDENLSEDYEEPEEDDLKDSEDEMSGEDLYEVAEATLYNAKKVRMQAQRDRALANKMARKDAIKDYFQDLAVRMIREQKQFVPSLGAPVKPNGVRINDTCAILQISDWHYGVDINNFDNVFNEKICQERLTKLLNETIEVCTNRKVSEIVVANLGDLICGRIHTQLRINGKYGIMKQINDVNLLLVDFLTKLSEKFKVRYYWCLDNHSRVEPNKDESIQEENLVYIQIPYLKLAFRDNPNITINEVNQFGDTITSFMCNGHLFIGVHGDLDKQRDMIRRISSFTHTTPAAILTAHLHHFSANEENHMLMLANGSLMGTDIYAEKLRLSSDPSQNLFIVTKDNPFDEFHRIVLS